MTTAPTVVFILKKLGESMLKKLVLILYLILTFLVCAHLDAEVTFSVPHEHTEVIY